MAACKIIAEIGINANGSLETALELIDVAKDAGADFCKFQKRSPRHCVPKAEWDKPRSTPWGELSYIEYRERVEFGTDEFDAIDEHCRRIGFSWFASAFDEPSVDFLNAYDCPYLKIPSAKATDYDFLKYAGKNRGGAGIILSTGACGVREVEDATDALWIGDPHSITCIMHCTSTYPCPMEELNLSAIKTLQGLYADCPEVQIGYSGHEVGIPTSVAAVAMGATMLERHITLDRTSWGSDHAASLEPAGLKRLVSYVRAVEKAMGDGELKIFDSERKAMQRLRVVA